MSTQPNANTARVQPFSVLETEKINPATSEIDRMSPLEIVRVINAEDTKVAEAVGQELPHIARAIEEIAARMRRGGRLLYFGAGTSGRLGALAERRIWGIGRLEDRELQYRFGSNDHVCLRPSHHAQEPGFTCP